MRAVTCARLALHGWMAIFAGGCLPLATAPRSDARFTVAALVTRTGYSGASQPGLVADETIGCDRVLRTLRDVYAVPVLLVATSAEEWRAEHQRLLDLQGFVVVPPPEPPAGVDWTRQAVLLVGMRDRGFAHPVRIVALGRHGSQLRADIEVDWRFALDPIEYSPSDLVRFDAWPGLKGNCLIGAYAVAREIQTMGLEVR